MRVNTIGTPPGKEEILTEKRPHLQPLVRQERTLQSFPTLLLSSDIGPSIGNPSDLSATMPLPCIP